MNVIHKPVEFNQIADHAELATLPLFGNRTLKLKADLNFEFHLLYIPYIILAQNRSSN